MQANKVAFLSLDKKVLSSPMLSSDSEVFYFDDLNCLYCIFCNSSLGFATSKAINHSNACSSFFVLFEAISAPL